MFETSFNKNIEEEVKKHLKDRSGRYLKELADYTLVFKLEDSAGDIEKADTIKDYCVYILVIYQNFCSSVLCPSLGCFIICNRYTFTL